jgi:hypothetical protein
MKLIRLFISDIVVLEHIFLVPSTPVFVHTFNSVCLAVVLRGELGFFFYLKRGFKKIMIRF